MSRIPYVILAIFVAVICMTLSIAADEAIPNAPVSLTKVNNHTLPEGSGTVALSTSQCRKQVNTNQGATDEVDFILPASRVGDSWLARQEEAQVMEICPETDGYIILDGSALDQNDCVDSNSVTIGSWAVFSRGKNASGTSVWFCDSDGNWTDTGATD